VKEGKADRRILKVSVGGGSSPSTVEQSITEREKKRGIVFKHLRWDSLRMGEGSDTYLKPIRGKKMLVCKLVCKFGKKRDARGGSAAERLVGKKKSKCQTLRGSRPLLGDEKTQRGPSARRLGEKGCGKKHLQAT